MKLGDWLDNAKLQLKLAGIPSPRLDSLILLEMALGHDRSWLLAHEETSLDDKQQKVADRLLNRRREREPLAYITGLKEFYGLPFKVTRDVLIPRPETETIVEHTVKHALSQASVLEIGTGSGAIAVALKFNRPDMMVTATDISAKALTVAKSNSKQHKVNINFVLGDLFEPFAGKFQVILANLPYVPNKTRSEPEIGFEPKLALFAGIDGLDYYRRFVAELRNFLIPHGWALIEASPTQRLSLDKLAKKSGFALLPISEYIFKLS